MKQEPLVEVWSRDLFETRNISERFQYAVSILVFFYVNTEEGFGYPRRSDAHKHLIKRDPLPLREQDRLEERHE